MKEFIKIAKTITAQEWFEACCFFVWITGLMYALIFIFGA